MTIPAPECPAVAQPPEPLRVRFPGGLAITAVPPLLNGRITDLGQVQALLAQVSPVMASLQPFFLLLEAATSIVDVVTAIPKAIGPPFDISGVAEAIKKMLESFAALAGVYPPVSLPLMLSDMIQLIVSSLKAIQTGLGAALEQVAAAEALAQKAIDENNPLLLETAQCQKALADTDAAHLIASIGPVGQVLDMMSSLAGLIGLELPSLADMAGEEIGPVLEVLQAIIDVLENIKIPG